MEKQSTCFICITYQGKQNDSVLLTNEQFTEQLEQTQTLSIQNVLATQEYRLPKIILTFECDHGETFFTFYLYNGNIMAPYF